MASRKPLRVPLRVVFYREGAAWIAHCLEFDLIGDGATRNDALEALSDAIVLQVEASLRHDNRANLFSPAEGKYFEMFAEGQEITKGVLEIQLIVERLRSASPIIDQVEAREYADCDPELAYA